MSAPNFKMLTNFPLYVRDFYVECEDGSSFEDDIEAEYIFQEVETAFESVNQNLLFHHLSICSGRYIGAQFDVELMNDLPLDMDNDDCHDVYQMCRSQAVKRYESECNIIRRYLSKMAIEFDFYEVQVYAQFSNGETIYAPVSSRVQLLAACAE